MKANLGLYLLLPKVVIEALLRLNCSE